MKACVIIYNAQVDKEVFYVIRSTGYVKHYIKWDDVKGTGSGGLNVLGPLEESNYCAVLIALPEEQANALFEEIMTLRKEMVHKTGLACLVLNADRIG